MKVAIVGLGRMGQRHCTVVRQLGLEISAACDFAEGARQQAATAFDLDEDRLFGDAFEMIERVRPDVLVVSTTAPSHKDLVLRASGIGTTAILCEKPMATSLADCEAMITACEATGIRLAVNHQMRFMEQYMLPKSLIASELLGGLGSIIVSAGNFGMAMNGTHYFEMFRYMTDEPADKVTAWFSKEAVPNPRGEQFSDVAGAVRVETPSGRRFYLDCSADQGHGMLVTYNCRYGRIVIDELQGTMTVVAREPAHRSLPTTRYGMPYITTHQVITPADAVAPTLHVLQALLAGGNYPDGRDGLAAMQVLVAAHMSNGGGGAAVNVSDADPSMVLPIA